MTSLWLMQANVAVSFHTICKNEACFDVNIGTLGCFSCWFELVVHLELKTTFNWIHRALCPDIWHFWQMLRNSANDVPIIFATNLCWQFVTSIPWALQIHFLCRSAYSDFRLFWLQGHTCQPGQQLHRCAALFLKVLIRILFHTICVLLFAVLRTSPCCLSCLDNVGCHPFSHFFTLFAGGLHPRMQQEKNGGDGGDGGKNRPSVRLKHYLGDTCTPFSLEDKPFFLSCHGGCDGSCTKRSVTIVLLLVEFWSATAKIEHPQHAPTLLTYHCHPLLLYCTFPFIVSKAPTTTATSSLASNLSSIKELHLSISLLGDHAWGQQQS